MAATCALDKALNWSVDNSAAWVLVKTDICAVLRPAI